MYIDQGEPSEKCGELNFALDYDFPTQTLKLKLIQVSDTETKAETYTWGIGRREHGDL
jgi:hypothetical protein